MKKEKVEGDTNKVRASPARVMGEPEAQEKQKTKPKKADAKKKELLDKRKKYDPRAALKKAKLATATPRGNSPSKDSTRKESPSKSDTL